MNIVQTNTITADPIQKTEDAAFTIFHNRRDLHEETIPPFFVYINENAWDEFTKHTNEVYRTTRHEGQGIFIGRYFYDEFGEFAVATSYQEGEGQSSYSTVEMSEQCLMTISKKCRAENLLMLVWIHTHPTFGAFYSGTDVACLKTNFFMPFQIGIVADIIRKEHKGFRVQSREVVEFKDYALYSEKNRELVTIYGSTKLKGAAKHLDIQIKPKESESLSSEAILSELRAIRGELAAITNFLKKEEIRADKAAQPHTPKEPLPANGVLKSEAPQKEEQSAPSTPNETEKKPNVAASPATGRSVNPEDLFFKLQELAKQNMLQLIALIVFGVLVAIVLILKVIF